MTVIALKRRTTSLTSIIWDRRTGWLVWLI